MAGLKRVSRRHDDALSRIAWDQFETLLAGYYRSQGYQVEHVGTGKTGRDSDGGVDLKLRRDDSYILVQCKRWTAMKVPHNAVHELLGIMVNQGATGAILITSGEFTKAAIEAASRQRNFELIDGHELRVMLGPAPESALGSLSRMRGPLANGAMPATGRRVVAKLVAAGALLLVATLMSQYMKGVVDSLPATIAPGSQKASAAVTSQTMQGFADTCQEVTATAPGPYSKDCIRGVPSGQRSAASRLEEQPKADEGIEVISGTTPEM